MPLKEFILLTFFFFIIESIDLKSCTQIETSYNLSQRYLRILASVLNNSEIANFYFIFSTFFLISIDFIYNFDIAIYNNLSQL